MDLNTSRETLLKYGITVDQVTLADASRTVQRLGRCFSAAAQAEPVRLPTDTSAVHRAVAAEEPGNAFSTPSELPPDITGLRSWICQGRISVAEALETQRRQLRVGDTEIHSVARLCPSCEPKASDVPLAGIGLAHKDNIACGDFAPGNGLPEDKRASRSPAVAPAIARLRNSGATQLATLVMAERACGATAENHYFPSVVNPLNDKLFVGGSSSGSAAAVAAGFCYGALGTDTAGSVRIPAASSGLLGFKPSRGVIAGEGVTLLAPSLDTVGLLTRSAADLQVLLQAATSDDQFRTGVDASALRVANTLNLERMAPEVAETLEGFLLKLGALQTMKRLVLELPRAVPAYGETVFYYEAGREHRTALAESAESMNTVARLLCTQGLLLPDEWHAQALAARSTLRNAFVERHFADADILVTPAFSISVPEKRHVSFGHPDFEPSILLEVYRWMMPASYLDLPALVLPVGIDAHGRPVSVQLLARPGSDAVLPALARRFEESHCGAPGLFGLGAPHMRNVYTLN